MASLSSARAAITSIRDVITSLAHPHARTHTHTHGQHAFDPATSYTAEPTGVAPGSNTEHTYAGLSSSEAAARRRAYGSNELTIEESESVCAKFMEKMKEPMIALLLASAGVSLLTGQIDDAISISLAVIIVITVAIVQEYKSDESLAALSRLAPHTCRVARDGRVVEAEAAELVPGDCVMVTVGDRVPADIRLLEAVGLSIDESSLTGENEPSEKTAAAVPVPADGRDVPIAERRCVAFMGTLVRAGRGTGIVVATGLSTELGAVCALMDKEEARKSPLQVRMDELSKTLSAVSFAIIGAIVLVGLAYHKPLLDMFTIGVSLAVAAIPEGLPIVVTVTLALGVQRMAAQRAVVKKLPAVEALGCASVICVDKTGTLTRNEMTAVEAFTLVNHHSGSRRGSGMGEPRGQYSGAAAAPAAIPSGLSASMAHHLLHDQLGRSIGSRLLFSGLGYDANGGFIKYAPVEAEDGALRSAPSSRRNSFTTTLLTGATHPHLGLLLETGSVCSDAVISRDPDTGMATLSGQPTEGALLVAAAKGGLDGIRAKYVRTHEIPFSSETKWMAVRARHVDTPANASQPADGTGPVPGEAYFVKGSVDAVLALCDYAVAPAGTPGAQPMSVTSALLGEELRRQMGVDAVPDYSVTPLSVMQRAAILAGAETMAREGLRVLALAKGDRIPVAARFEGTAHPRMVLTASPRAHDAPPTTAETRGGDLGAIGGMVFLGLVGLHDPPREGVIDTIRTLRHGGVRVCMITGDSEATALAIGAHLGLVDEYGNAAGSGDNSSDCGTPTPAPSQPLAGAEAAFAAGARAAIAPTGALADVGAEHEVDTEALAVRGAAISGAEVDALNDEELAQRVRTVSVFYRTTPKHKMKIVHAFQRLGFVVAMTGDGVNDAPALKVADIGVAMGRSGTDVAKEAADMVLVDDNFTTILGAIEEGKGIFYNIRNFVRFQLSTSVAALTLVAASTLLGLPNPLNAMQILWINIIMDGPPAQSLGVEAVDPDVMRQPPRKSSEPIITRELLVRVITSAFIIVAGTLYVFYTEMAHDFTATRRDTTMTFTTFVMFDMFNALACRSADKSLFSLGLFSNRFFGYAVGGSLLGQLAVVYLPPLQAVFQTESLSLHDWLYILALTSTVLWVDELRKAFFPSVRGRRRRAQHGPCAEVLHAVTRFCPAKSRRRLRYGVSLLSGDAAAEDKRTDAAR